MRGLGNLIENVYNILYRRGQCNLTENLEKILYGVVSVT